MDRLTKRQAQLAEERMAAAMGRPVRVCAECGEYGAHWSPAALDEAGNPTAGFFTCAPPITESQAEGLF